MLTVILPDALLVRLQERAREAGHTVEEEVFKLLSVALSVDAPPQGGVAEDRREAKNNPSRTSLADWAEENGEYWGDELRSDDVEGFTGRRF